MTVVKLCQRCGYLASYHAEHEPQGVVCQRCGGWVKPPAERDPMEWMTPDEAEEVNPHYAGVLRGLYLTTALMFFVCAGVPALTMGDLPLREHGRPSNVPRFVNWLCEVFLFTGVAFPVCLFAGWWCLVWGSSSRARDWLRACRWLALGWTLLAVVLCLIRLPFRLTL